MTLRIATVEDIAYVVANMRPEDVRELWKGTGKSAYEAVAELDSRPYVAFTVARDVPVAIFGATLHDGFAQMFRFATPRWPEAVRETIRIGRRVMLPRFKSIGLKYLTAQTLADSDTRWLRAFGAKEVGGRVDEKGNRFKLFAVQLAA